MSSPLAAAEGGVSLQVKVVPGATRDRIAGLLGDHLKVQIAAPAEGGRANAALIQLLAAAFGMPARAVTVRQGVHQARKRVLLDGLGLAEASARLARLLAAVER